MAPSMPFNLKLLRSESDGTKERLEALRHRFLQEHLHGIWHKPSSGLRKYIGALDGISNRGVGGRVSLDLGAAELARLETLVVEAGTRTKARLLRRALVVYGRLHELNTRGYVPLAVKDDRMVKIDLEEA